MGHHSVAETKNKLSELIDRALAGEGVVITRHGRPVIEFRPVEPQPETTMDEALRWLADFRRGRPPSSFDSAVLIRQMRDEWDR